MAALSPGSRLGPYTVGPALGEGGMAVVYRATHVATGREVALKVMRPELLEDAVVRARFLREARVAARFRHPCAVEVLESGEAAGSGFLAMELVAGATLADVLRGAGPLAPPRAARIFDQVLGALGAAHEGGVVHRDLKPANIMVAPPDDRVKVLDFGIARIVAVAGGTAVKSLTAQGEFLGTLLYASPEQIRDAKIDARGDLYQVGLIVFEALTGRRPHEATTVPKLVRARLTEPAPAVSALRPGLPRGPEIDAFVARALAKEPDARFPSAAEMRAALLAALG